MAGDFFRDGAVTFRVNIDGPDDGDFISGAPRHRSAVRRNPAAGSISAAAFLAARQNREDRCGAPDPLPDRPSDVFPGTLSIPRNEWRLAEVRFDGIYRPPVCSRPPTGDGCKFFSRRGGADRSRHAFVRLGKTREKKRTGAEEGGGKWWMRRDGDIDEVDFFLFWEKLVIWSSGGRSESIKNGDLGNETRNAKESRKRKRISY